MTSEELVNVLVLKLPEISVSERVNVAYWVSTTKVEGSHFETLGLFIYFFYFIIFFYFFFFGFLVFFVFYFSHKL